MIIFCDNKSIIAIAKNPMQHGKAKHILVKYHAIKEAKMSGEVKLVHCSLKVQLAEISTKELPKNRFETLKVMLSVFNKSTQEEY